MRVAIDVSVGELIDRITILELKLRRLPRATRPSIARELSRARAVRSKAVKVSRPLRELTQKLRSINLLLWNTEEELRACERRGRFGRRFVALARTVYQTNDRRAALKRQLDELAGSRLREYKSHVLPTV